jgi:hypothetical protein
MLHYHLTYTTRFAHVPVAVLDGSYDLGTVLRRPGNVNSPLGVIAFNNLDHQLNFIPSAMRHLQVAIFLFQNGDRPRAKPSSNTIEGLTPMAPRSN